MKKAELKSEDFIEFSNWLSSAHRNPLKLGQRSHRIVKNHQVELITPKANSESSHKKHADPIVHFEEAEGLIKKVEITCTCGEKLLLSLDYDEETDRSNS